MKSIPRVQVSVSTDGSVGLSLPLRHHGIWETQSEWRCACPADGGFDPGINPKWVSACCRCGLKRPTEKPSRDLPKADGRPYVCR